MLEVQRYGPQAIAIFCKGMKGTWFTATRMQDSANFWRKRSDVLGIVSVLCWLVGLRVAALRIGHSNAAGDRQNVPKTLRASSETNALRNRRA